jgi:hypothetical protein
MNEITDSQLADAIPAPPRGNRRHDLRAARSKTA